MSEILDAALRYREHGWSVIPCEAKGKKPLIKWQPYQKRLPTETEIKKWWKQWPDANVAVITGKISGIVVIDIDTDRGGEKNGQPETGLVARTGSGGYHLFYRHVGGRIENEVGRDGVDVRGDGGYVIVAPSVHANGRMYSWDATDSPTAFRHRRKETSDSKPVNRDGWISSILAGVETGERNDAAARLSGYFDGKGIPPDIAIGFIQQWNERQEQPLDSSEIETTVRSVYRTAKRRGNEKQRDSRFTAMPVRAYSLEYGLQETKWCIEGWLPDATIAIMSSPPGSFKTWELLDLAVSVASGEKYLDCAEVKQQGPVLIVQQEDPHNLVVERLSIIMLGHRRMLPPTSDGETFDTPVMIDMPIHVHTDRRLRFDDKDILESVEKLIAKIKPRLVIIDPLYSAASTDDYMAKAAEQMFVLKRWRDDYGCSFVIAHHTNKAADSWDRQTLWGSQFLNAFLETGIQLRRYEDEEAIVARRHFKTSGKMPPVKITFDIDTSSSWRYKVTVEEVDDDEAKRVSSKETGQAQYVDILANADEPMTMGQLAKAAGKSKSSVSRALKKLESKGEVKKDDHGMWSSNDLPSF